MTSFEPLYYECHITIEPVFEEKLELFEKLSSNNGFKVANLLMQKRKFDLPERSDKDSFCTGRSKEYNIIYDRMNNLIKDLTENNFKVWRKKIEAILFDEKSK